jgi:hypothetical protein
MFSNNSLQPLIITKQVSIPFTQLVDGFVTCHHTNFKDTIAKIHHHQPTQMLHTTATLLSIFLKKYLNKSVTLARDTSPYETSGLFFE